MAQPSSHADNTASATTRGDPALTLTDPSGTRSPPTAASTPPTTATGPSCIDTAGHSKPEPKRNATFSRTTSWTHSEASDSSEEDPSFTDLDAVVAADDTNEVVEDEADGLERRLNWWRNRSKKQEAVIKRLQRELAVYKQTDVSESSGNEDQQAPMETQEQAEDDGHDHAHDQAHSGSGSIEDAGHDSTASDPGSGRPGEADGRQDGERESTPASSIDGIEAARSGLVDLPVTPDFDHFDREVFTDLGDFGNDDAQTPPSTPTLSPPTNVGRFISPTTPPSLTQSQAADASPCDSEAAAAEALELIPFPRSTTSDDGATVPDALPSEHSARAVTPLSATPAAASSSLAPEPASSSTSPPTSTRAASILATGVGIDAANPSLSQDETFIMNVVDVHRFLVASRDAAAYFGLSRSDYQEALSVPQIASTDDSSNAELATALRSAFASASDSGGLQRTLSLLRAATCRAAALGMDMDVSPAAFLAAAVRMYRHLSCTPTFMSCLSRSDRTKLRAAVADLEGGSDETMAEQLCHAITFRDARGRHNWDLRFSALRAAASHIAPRGRGTSRHVSPETSSSSTRHKLDASPDGSPSAKRRKLS